MVRIKAAVYTRKNGSEPLWWGIMSDTLPPGVNQMYNVGIGQGSDASAADGILVPPSGPGPAGAGRNKGKRKASFYLSSKASQWKNTVGETIRRSSFGYTPGEGPYCSFLHLFVFDNYDTDNRLKLMNDTLQGAIISNDKSIRRSAQLKTVVRKRADIGFMYFIAQRRNFDSLFSVFSGFADRIEGDDGKLLPEYDLKTHQIIVDFFARELSMDRRMICGM